MDLSPTTSLPPTINVPSETGTQLRHLVDELKKLKGTHAFYIRDRLTVYFLIGRSDAEGWAGLAGVGVQT